MPDIVTVAFSRAEVGDRGWQALHDDASLRGRKAGKQALALIQYALRQRLDGRNTELSQSQLERLLEGDIVETVA